MQYIHLHSIYLYANKIQKNDFHLNSFNQNCCWVFTGGKKTIQFLEFISVNWNLLDIFAKSQRSAKWNHFH